MTQLPTAALPLLSVTTALALSVGATPNDLPRQKEVRTEVSHVDFNAPPPTLEEMIGDASAVVVGRITGKRLRDNEPGPLEGPDILRSSYTVRVSEIIHSSDDFPARSAELVVVREEGERDRGSYIERWVQEGFPAFVVGHEYVLFLVWNQALEAWRPAYGPDSAFDVTADTVSSTGVAAVTKQLKTLTRAELLGSLRAHGR